MELTIYVKQHIIKGQVSPGQFKCIVDITHGVECVYTHSAITSGTGIAKFTENAINKYEELLKAQS